MTRSFGSLGAVLAFSSLLIAQDSPRQPSQVPSTGQTMPSSPENPANPPAQALLKLTSRSDLVLVPVVVTDKSGKNVPGLQKEAFQIEENGKVRSVSIFEEEQLLSNILLDLDTTLKADYQRFPFPTAN